MRAKRITWRYIESELWPAVVRAAEEARCEMDGWSLEWAGGEVPLMVVEYGSRKCHYRTPREAETYMRGWIDALNVVAGRY